MSAFRRAREILSPEEKALKTLKSLIGEDAAQEMDAMDLEDLNKRIAVAHESINAAKEELEANAEYKRVVSDKKLLSSGFNEVKKRQNAVIKYALQARRDRGAA